LLYIMQIQN